MDALPRAVRHHCRGPLDLLPQRGVMSACAALARAVQLRIPQVRGPFVTRPESSTPGPRRSAARLVAAIACLLFAAGLLVPAGAQSPASTHAALDAAFPAGGRPGTVVEVSLRGVALEAPARVLVSGTGVEVRSIQGVSGREVRGALAIAEDAAPGI